MYCYQDLISAYQKLQVEPGKTIALKTDLLKLGSYEKKKKQEILEDHLNALKQCFDLQQHTIVVATSSRNLCNTDIPYNPETTPSTTGALTEHIRKSPEAVRSFHAFDSYTAIGKQSKEICLNTSRFSYGINTPEERMVEDDATCISIGMEPRLSISTIHHVEMMANVPYRYVKEHIHPVEQNGIISHESFFRHVQYMGCGIQRSWNIELFELLEKKGMKIRSSDLGSGKIYAFSLKQFYQLAMDIFLENPYIWLKEPPTDYPWRK